MRLGYNQCARKGTELSDDQTTRALENALRETKILNSVRADWVQKQIDEGKSTDITLEVYVEKLLNFTQVHDASITTGPRARSSKFTANNHDFFGDDDEQEEEDGPMYGDEDAFYKMNRHRFNANNSDSSSQPFTPKRRVRMSLDQWKKMPREDQVIWDTLSDTAKSIVLTGAYKKGGDDREAKLTKLKSEDRTINTHDMFEEFDYEEELAKEEEEVVERTAKVCIIDAFNAETTKRPKGMDKFLPPYNPPKGSSGAL